MNLRSIIAAIVAAAALVGLPCASAADTLAAPVLVPLVNPIGAKSGDAQFQGLFRKVVTARGAELDDSRAGQHKIRTIGVSDTFPSNTPEIYVVVELLQPTFADFRLICRFILEDPEGKPIGTLLYTDRAQFENEDTGGFLVMKQPPGGFPVGKYRVELHYEAVNEISLLNLASFKVVPAAAK